MQQTWTKDQWTRCPRLLLVFALKSRDQITILRPLPLSVRGSWKWRDGSTKLCVQLLSDRRLVITESRRDDSWMCPSHSVTDVAWDFFQAKRKKVYKLKYLGIFCGLIMTWKHVNSVNMVTQFLSGQTSAFRSMSTSQTFFIVQYGHLSNVFSSFSFVVSQPPRCVSLFPLCPLLIHQMPQQGRDSCSCSPRDEKRSRMCRESTLVAILSGRRYFWWPCTFYFSSRLPWVYSSFTSFEHP